MLGLGVLAGLGLCLGVMALPSGEPAGLIFLEGGGPEADCRSLLNSNFLFAGGYEETINVSNYKKWHLFRMQKILCTCMFKTGALDEILLNDEWNKVDSQKLSTLLHLMPEEGHLTKTNYI